MGTKCPMFFNSSCLIKLHSSRHPFSLPCATTNLPCIPFPMQTMNHSLVPPLSLTNHLPILLPAPSPSCDCGPPTLHFPKLLWSCTSRFFPLPLYWPIWLPTIKPLNLPPSLQCVHNFHLKSLAPLVGINLLFKG
jgi:hypothetical protein